MSAARDHAQFEPFDDQSLAAGRGNSVPQRKRWTVTEFHHLRQAGVIRHDERLELIRGEIFNMSPMNACHATGMRKVRLALLRIFTDGFVVSDQLPLALSEESEPYPDFSVVRGDVDDFAERHPAAAELIVEVSDSTIRFDRTEKAALYAAAGIPEFWIVDLTRRRVEVRRDPIVAQDGNSVGEYRVTAIFMPGQSISPLSLPNRAVTVDDLLPRAKEHNS